jgi:hypothetical protein
VLIGWCAVGCGCVCLLLRPPPPPSDRVCVCVWGAHVLSSEPASVRCGTPNTFSHPPLPCHAPACCLLSDPTGQRPLVPPPPPPLASPPPPSPSIAQVDGLPQSGSLTKNDFDLFIWDFLPGFSGVEISLTARSGTPVLYGALGGRTPSSADFDFSMYGAQNQNSLTINASDPTFVQQCGTGVCRFTLQIKGGTAVSGSGWWWWCVWDRVRWGEGEQEHADAV